MTDEKQFSPTPARREQARREGQFPRGSDITAIAVATTGLLMFFGGGHWMMERLGQLVADSFADVRLSTAPSELGIVVSQKLSQGAIVALPVMGIVFLAAVATQLAQSGLQWMPHRIAPDWGRINPISGLQKSFSLRRWFDGLFVVVRIAIVVAIGAFGLWSSRVHLVAPAGSRAYGIGEVTLSALGVIVTVALVMCVVAVFEYGYRWWQHENSLRMSAEEIREDHREQEGDLRVRALRRGAHQEIARRRPHRHHGDESFLQAAADDSEQ